MTPKKNEAIDNIPFSKFFSSLKKHMTNLIFMSGWYSELLAHFIIIKYKVNILKNKTNIL
jgi:hypothetical protein